MFTARWIALGAAVAGSQLVAAQSLAGLNISQTCIGALTGIITSQDASCLSAGTLLSIATQSPSNSVIPVINTWLTSLCSQAPCSNTTLTALANNISAGCASDFGLSSSTASSITPMVLQLYPTARQIVCLKNGNTLCPTELLTGVQTALGQNLSISNIASIIPQITSNGGSAINSTVVCTNCSKQSYNLLNAAYPTSTVTDYFRNTCPADFLNGQQPSGISSSASQSSSGGNGGGSGDALGRLGDLSPVHLVLALLSIGLIA